MAQQQPAGDDPYEVGRIIALRRIESAPRTRSDVFQHLRSRGIPDDVADAVCDRFVEVGLIDDVAFAHAWVESRFRSKGNAPLRLRSELQRKGVSAEVIEDALAQIEAEALRERAMELALGLAPKYAGQEPATAVRKLAAALSRRGYPGNIVWSVAGDACSSCPELTCPELPPTC